MKDARKLNTVVNKLNTILNNRFGVTIAYLDLEETATAPNERAVETVKRNAGSPMILANGELLIPMRVDGSLVGATKVDKIKGLLPKDLGQIKDTIELILNEVVAAQHRIELLEISERFVREGGPNVISLSDRRLAMNESI